LHLLSIHNLYTITTQVFADQLLDTRMWNAHASYSMNVFSQQAAALQCNMRIQRN